MARPPRTRKTGDIPIAQDTQRVSRVRTIRLLMSEGSWRNEASKMAFCRDWRCSPATMDDYVREASRSLRYDLADHPDEIVHRVACVASARMADMVQRIEDQVAQEIGEDGKPVTVSTIGRKGKMSWQAYAQLNQTVLGALDRLASMVNNHGAAFLPKDQQADAGAPTRPAVTVLVKYANVSDEPKPPETAPPPADASTPTPK